jgi:hypothetical protein
MQLGGHGVAQALVLMAFMVFNRGKPPRYNTFSGVNFHFVKSTASVAISGPKYTYEK